MKKQRQQYSPAQRDRVYAWRNASEENMEKHRLTVRRANARRIEEAREILAGSIADIKCAVSGCEAEPDMLQFHHKNGDGNKEKDRTQHTVARWIIKNPDKGRKKIELRCKYHHDEIDVALGLRCGEHHRHKLTTKQVLAIRRAKKVPGYRIKLSKKYKVHINTIYQAVNGITWKHLLVKG
jgi:hypothetical protein